MDFWYQKHLVKISPNFIFIFFYIYLSFQELNERTFHSCKITHDLTPIDPLKGCSRFGESGEISDKGDKLAVIQNGTKEKHIFTM